MTEDEKAQLVAEGLVGIKRCDWSCHLCQGKNTLNASDMANVIDHAIFRAALPFSSNPSHLFHPGSVIERLPYCCRNALANMTSEDLQKMRFLKWLIPPT